MKNSSEINFISFEQDEKQWSQYFIQSNFLPNKNNYKADIVYKFILLMVVLCSNYVYF